MKKILLLGGSSQQIIAIESARKMGYYTVLCDFLPDNPGQYVADKFYLVSTTNKNAILKVAIDENIDGILAYASDPAAPTAAYVAEKLGLPGNSYESVKTLCNKDLFRKFLKKINLNSPKSKGYSDEQTVMLNANLYEYPVIIKPVDSSGSKGATVVKAAVDLKNAVEYAFSFSRLHRIIVEHYIEKKHPYLIGGDIFIKDGKVILWGLLNCHRDFNVNPLVPVGKSYPLQLDLRDYQEIKNTLLRMIDGLGIKNGAMNVELVVDNQNRVWPIDVGPRCGGNMIPDLLSDIFDIDIVKMSICSAMGEAFESNILENNGYYATHNLHSEKKGIYEDISFSSEIKKYIYRKIIYKKLGDQIEYFDNASKCLGIIFMKFPNADIMKKILNNINEHIEIKLR